MCFQIDELIIIGLAIVVLLALAHITGIWNTRLDLSQLPTVPAPRHCANLNCNRVIVRPEHALCDRCILKSLNGSVKREDETPTEKPTTGTNNPNNQKGGGQ